MEAPSSQGKSEVAISEVSEEPLRRSMPELPSHKVVTSYSSSPLPFRTPILYPFYFKVLTENPFSTKFVFRSASRKPILTRFPLFLLFFLPTCVCICVLFLWFFPIFCNFHGFGPFWNYFGITISKQIKSTPFVARAQSSWKHRSLQLSVMQTMTTSGTGSVTKPASGKNRPATASCQLGHLGQSNIKRLIVSFLRFWMMKPNFHQTNACFSFFKFDVKTLPNKSPSFVAFVFSSSKKLNCSILFLVYSIPLFAVFCFLIGVITPLSAVFHRLFQVIKIFAQSLLIPGRRRHSSCALTAPWKAHDIDEISTVTELSSQSWFLKDLERLN